jgi:hypothetical protein
MSRILVEGWGSGGEAGHAGMALVGRSGGTVVLPPSGGVSVAGVNRAAGDPGCFARNGGRIPLDGGPYRLPNVETGGKGQQATTTAVNFGVEG